MWSVFGLPQHTKLRQFFRHVAFYRATACIRTVLLSHFCRRRRLADRLQYAGQRSGQSAVSSCVQEADRRSRRGRRSYRRRFSTLPWRCRQMLIAHRPSTGLSRLEQRYIINGRFWLVCSCWFFKILNSAVLYLHRVFEHISQTKSHL